MRRHYRGTVNELEQLRTLGDPIAYRDRLVAECRRSGWQWKDIAAAAGMSLQATRNAAIRANDGTVPTPREGATKPGARNRPPSN